MSASPPALRRPPPAARQSGLVLIVALVLLLAMSIAGIALIRSIDTNSLLAGNLAFRQGAAMAGDVGVELARSYLLSHLDSLDGDVPGDGYYATRQNAIDLTGNRTPGQAADNVQWPNSPAGMATPYCQANPDSVDNRICYIIHRMCNSAGPAAIESCSTQVSGEANAGTSGGVPAGSSRGTVAAREGYQGQFSGLPASATNNTVLHTYYRITVRIEGPRNNVSFIQAFLLV